MDIHEGDKAIPHLSNEGIAELFKLSESGLFDVATSHGLISAMAINNAYKTRFTNYLGECIPPEKSLTESDADKKFANFAERVLFVVDERRKNNPNFSAKFIRISEEFYDEFRHWFVGQYPYNLDLRSYSISIYGIRIYSIAEQETPILVTDANEVICLG